MKCSQHTKKFGFIAAFLLTMTGTYNAVVINSQSDIAESEVKFVKRLDETYGVITPGRKVASVWKKLPTPESKKIAPIIQTVGVVHAAPKMETKAPNAHNFHEAPAAIQEDLNLNLTEVVNAKKWQSGLKPEQYSGNLATGNGAIQSLSILLPEGQGLSLSFTEMKGNVFEYDLDGETFSGMVYPVNQDSYMVTLTNGPLEGTQLRFSGASANETQVQVQEELAQNHQVEVGDFGTAVNLEATSTQF